MGWGAVGLILIAAVGACPAAGHAQTRSPAEPAKPAPQKETDYTPPIAFFVAKGEAGSCGPGCSEWIAADGTIDTAAPARLRAFLAKLGRRSLPIYFQSPGGSVGGAIEIGRMMRARGITAGVARTIPQGCDPRLDREAACDALKRTGRELPAELRTVHTLCNSSCVYALIGAKVREVTAGARIGVHAIALGMVDASSGQIKPIIKETPSRTDGSNLKRANEQLAQYLAEMGIDRGLFDAAAEIRHERVRYISRDEIARFGIDRREFHESRWVVDEGPRFVVVKFATQAHGSDPKQYRTTKIQLTCSRSGPLGVLFSRELAATDTVASIAVTARGGDFVLPPRRGKPILGYNDVEMEDRFARVPIAFFEEAATGETLELTEAPDLSALDKPPRRIRLSTAGLASAIRALAQRCP